VPTQVSLPCAAAAASAGAIHSAVVSQEGTLLVFGAGGSGQLGLGDRCIQRSAPLAKPLLPLECGLSNLKLWPQGPRHGSQTKLCVSAGALDRRQRRSTLEPLVIGWSQVTVGGHAEAGVTVAGAIVSAPVVQS